MPDRTNLKGNLLINGLYYPAIGHTIEVLKLTNAFRTSDPELHISLLLHARSGVELVPCVPVVDRLYTIDLSMSMRGSVQFVLDQIPRDWDYLLTPGWVSKSTGWKLLDECHEQIDSWLRGKVTNHSGGLWIPDLPAIPLRLQLPEAARSFASQFLTSRASPRITLLPAAGSWMRSPTERFWAQFLDAFFDAHPTGNVVLLGSTDRSRSYTQAYDLHKAERLVRNNPHVHNGFNLGLLNQLAIAERCDLHVSPHSGFSFAVQCVGTPWLALSGMKWPESLNHVPFYAVYPDCPLYPCQDRVPRDCRSRMQALTLTPCMEEDALVKKLPEVMRGVQVLLNQELSTTQLTLRHHAAIKRRQNVVDKGLEPFPLYSK
jgi:hypothetical protein